MAVLAKSLASVLAGVTFFGISMLSASAQEGTGISVGGIDVGVNDNGGNGLGAGVSIGGANGVNADVGLGGSGSGGLGASVNASVGGSRGANADVDATASIGGGGSGGLADVDATASIGGGGGVNVGAGANVGGGGVDLDVSVGIGGAGSTLPGVVQPVPGRTVVVDPNTGGTTGSGRSSTAIAGMSDAEVARFARRCAEILGNPSSYDSDLVGLCRAIRASN